MVLKRRSMPEAERRGNAGVTLIELLVGISLSTVVVGMVLALFKDAGFAARLGAGRRDAGFQAQAMFASLSENLMTGGGILRLGPGHLEILNLRNRRMDYRWEDSTLKANGKTWNFRLGSLEVIPEGPSRPEAKDFGVETPWDLDSLDGDRDGLIGFAELDRDRSGELEADECRYIARITLRMTTIFHDVPNTQVCVIHPRNRVPVAEGQDAEDLLESGGIPEP
ncbi:MAG: hypothetical protein JWP91_3515 [Fibrobacteres bacterium]|nr:hypothetical protein [Fibrobacterota bacterium]